MNDQRSPARSRASAIGDGLGPVQELLSSLYEKHRTDVSGKLPDYIPELAAGNPEAFGVAVAMTDGFVYEVGDSRVPFTAQSISKAIVYGIALSDHGRTRVLRTIGVEPSGESFNSIVFDERNNRPFNPMVNAGAIAATSLVKGDSPSHRLSRILDTFTHFVGHPVAVDEAVYRSEAATGYRNRAIAYLERNAGMIEDDIDEHLDLYFRQCAIQVSARDLAVMATTLANDGINPLTGARALAGEHVRDVLSVMSTCGMYDYAGEWQFSVGLPAKSGVSGGIVAVLPGQLGIGVFSPRLDEIGNSVRGLAIATDLSRSLKLHLLDHRGRERSAIRRSYRSSEVRSKRVRRQIDTVTLDRLGHEIVVYELQGDLRFANTESLVRRVLREIDGISHVVLDAERVISVDVVSGQLLEGLARDLAAQEIQLALVVRHPIATPETQRTLAELSARAGAHEIDLVLELCEDRVLAAAGGRPMETDGSALDLADVDVLQDLSADEIASLKTRMTRSQFAKGDYLAREGDDSDRLFFITRGAVDVEVSLGPSGDRHRVSTIAAGTTVGELAMFAAGRRTADVIAVSDVECYVLDRRALDALAEATPVLWARLLRATGRTLADRLRRADDEIRALSR